jgi:N-acyl-D-aspartate/D-glutamate deacylase
MVPKAIMSLASGFMMDAIPNWSSIIALPHAERRKAILDPEVQARMQAGLDQLTPQSIVQAFKDVPNFLIEAAAQPHNQKWIGRTIGEYASAHDKDPFVAFLLLSAEEDLRLAFSTRTHYDDPESWQIRAAAWKDPRCIVGGSDAGAHLDMLNTFAFASEFLNHGVRQHQLVTLEEAVRLMTSVPADRFGLTDRGRLEPGAWADIVVFDPKTVASGPFGMRPDLPCGESRVYSEAVGIPHVIVNGVPVIRNGKPTGAVSGRILRSGRDTHTVAAH